MSRSTTSRTSSPKKSFPVAAKKSAPSTAPKKPVDIGRQAAARFAGRPLCSSVSSEEWAAILIDLWRVHERAAAASKKAGGHPYMTAISAAVVGLSLAAQKAADEVTFTVLAAHALESQARGVAFEHLTGDVRASVAAVKGVGRG